MLLNQASFFCPSTKSSFQQPVITKLVSLTYKSSSEKTNLSLFSNESVLRRYPYFPSFHHPFESKIEAESVTTNGIGIVKFFHGKNIFITGATGLVGKAFIEKLLRSTSVGKIYMLIRAEDKEAALDRLMKEIVNSELLKCVREKHGNYYQAFVKEKLIPVVGNICEPNLGMDSDSAHAIMNDVDVIIESAASTTLNDRYDNLLDTNVVAPQRLMRFAKSCKNLQMFVHISTAYVNREKEGLILEKPLTMGENGWKDRHQSSSSIPRLDLVDEISLAMKSSTTSANRNVTKDLKLLGQKRANLFGWNNAYQLTKAMGEMILSEITIRGDVPVLIIRPSVIESSHKEPFPGWIQGNRMVDPMIISYGKGQLPACLVDPEERMDIIPVDVVVNSIIAAIAKHGVIHRPQLNVYHVSSSDVNPLHFSEFFDIIYDYFNSTSLFKIKNIKKIKCFNNFNDFSKYTRDEISRFSKTENIVDIDEKKLQRQNRAKIAYAEQLCKMYEFVGFFRGRFHTGNIQKLLQEMSEEEKLDFEVDAMNIDWRKYFLDIHIPGLRKYVLNDSGICV